MPQTQRAKQPETSTKPFSQALAIAYNAIPESSDGTRGARAEAAAAMLCWSAERFGPLPRIVKRRELVAAIMEPAGEGFGANERGAYRRIELMVDAGLWTSIGGDVRMPAADQLTNLSNDARDTMNRTMDGMDGMEMGNEVFSARSYDMHVGLTNLSNDPPAPSPHADAREENAPAAGNHPSQGRPDSATKGNLAGPLASILARVEGICSLTNQQRAIDDLADYIHGALAQMGETETYAPMVAGWAADVYFGGPTKQKSFAEALAQVRDAFARGAIKNTPGAFLNYLLTKRGIQWRNYEARAPPKPR